MNRQYLSEWDEVHVAFHTVGGRQLAIGEIVALNASTATVRIQKVGMPIMRRFVGEKLPISYDNILSIVR